VLVAAQGDPVHGSVLAAVLGREAASPALRALGELGLDEPDGAWHRGAAALSRSTPRRLQFERWSAALARAIAAWAHHSRGTPDAWARGAGAWRQAHAELLAGEATGRHEGSRRLQQDVALARRWGAWRTMLLDGVEHAEAAGDTAARAWALHQLGSRALCLGDRMAARACLAEARDLRWRTGDRAGAAVTQHNLTLATSSGNGQAHRRSWLSAWASRARGRGREPIG
jgi:hypothetical protein